MASPASFDGIVEAVRTRRYKGRHGIAFAKSYLSSIDGCFVGGLCPEKTFDSATPAQWSKAMKDAEKALVYHNPGMEVKGYSEAASIAKGACLEFDCTLTTTTKDRDGDILETKGATLDPKHPLLWQHVPFEPVGKYLSTIKHTGSGLRVKYAVIDSAFGRDTAQLIKFGALRMSHGFKPKAWDAITAKSEDGDDVVTGFHVKEFDIYEGSVVSIPSNPDGMIEAYAAEKLHTPLVKQLAKGYYDARPRSVTSGFGGGLRLKVGGQVVSIKPAGGKSNGEGRQGGHRGQVEHRGGHACGCLSGEQGQGDGGPGQLGRSVQDGDRGSGEGRRQEGPVTTKGGGAPSTKGLHGHLPLMLPPIEGSWEQTSYMLEEAGEKYLKGKELIKEYEDALLIATFPDKAIFAKASYWSSKIEDCWELGWEMADGRPTPTGKPKAVEVTTDVQTAAKSIMDLRAKMGSVRKADGGPVTQKGGGGTTTTTTTTTKPAPEKAAKISQKNRDRIGDARGLADEVRAKDATDKSSKVLLEKAVSLLDEVLTDAAGTDDAATPKSVDEAARVMVAAVAAGDAAGVRAAHAEVGTVLEAVRKAAAAEEFEKMFS